MKNREIKFQIEIQHTNGDKQVIVNSLFDVQNGMCYHELGHGWKINWYRQYTGLKDKNGVEIFQGDVLRKTYGSSTPIFVVDYHAERGLYVAVDGYNMPLFEHALIHCEVIGNIYQNPELLPL